jgi:hypothetical protein
VDDVIGPGLVLRDITGLEGTRLVEPTKQLLEIEAIKHLLDFWNRSTGAAWNISDRPDKRERNRPAPDFACEDASSRSTALIDVARLPLKKHFERAAKQSDKELVITSTETREIVQRLLARKNKQLIGAVDRRCVLFLIDGVISKDDPLWTWFLSAIKEVAQSSVYPNVEEIYMWSQRRGDPPFQITP